MHKKLAVVFLIFAFSCKPDLKNPKATAGDADFSKFVALGGSFMSGYQDGALTSVGQVRSVSNFLSQHLVDCGMFHSPFMSDDLGFGINPKPWESNFESASRLRYKTDCQGVSSLFPIKDNFNISSAGIYLQHLNDDFQNISVPFAKISDYNNPSLGVSGNSNPYYARFASNPGVSTMLSDAKARQPTFFALWAGMEDIYDYVSNGGYKKTILSSSSFSLSLDSVLSALNTKGVIANIPDLASFPFYTTVPWNGVELTQNQADSFNLTLVVPGFFKEGKNGFMIYDVNSTTPPYHYRHMVEGEYVLLTVPLDSIKCKGMGVASSGLPNRYVLDSAEVRVINQAISDYNVVIAAKAQQYNLALVDANSYFKKVQAGIKWDGVDFSATFVSGGFYSLDGYHPNQKGYALVANEFIRAINSKYNATVPTVNCPECSGVKFP